MDAHWGGRAWKRLIDQAFDFIGPDLTGQHALELGFRDGAISCALAERGAFVTGLEVKSAHVDEARERARRLRLTARTKFRLYDGDLQAQQGQFDLIFTKSVLVLTDLDVVLPAVQARLKPDGRFVFIENAAGPGPVRLLRYLARRPATYRGVHYFTPQHIDLIAQSLQIERFAESTLPPVYLLCGSQKFDANAELFAASSDTGADHDARRHYSR